MGEKEDKVEIVKQLDQEIKDENLRILSKMLITACAAQIAVDGLDELSVVGVFNKGTKIKMQNFQNFILREMKGLVNLCYELDEEMTQYLLKSMENYLEVNFMGLANADPEEIIARYYNAD